MRKNGFIVLNSVRICARYAPGHTSAIVILNLVSGLMVPVSVFVVAAFLDSAATLASGAPQTLTLAVSAAIMLLIYMFMQMSQVIIRFLFRCVENRLRTELRPEMVKKQASLDFELLENEKTLDLIAFVFENMESRFTGILSDINTALCMLVQIAGVLSILIMHAWWLVVVFACITIPLVALSFKGGAAIYETDKEATMLTRLMNYLSKVLTDRDTGAERTLFGYTDIINEKFKKTHLMRSNLTTKVLARWNIRVKACAAVLIVFTTVTAVVLLGQVSDKTVTVGMYISIVGTMVNLFKSLSGTLAKLIFNLAGHIEYMKDYSAFLALEGDGAILEHRNREASFEYMEIKNLRFKYKDSDRYILKGVNLRMERGKSYSLVGQNGAGKTTLTKIITGLYRNYEGEILINGRNHREYEPDELRGIFSVIYQDFARYHISLRENVILGDEGASSFDAMADLLELNGIIQKLPLGTDNPLGKIYDGSQDLSGGEWQKLAIARASYRKRPFMILDEPTASLSPVMESDIYGKFADMPSGSAKLLISHRLGSTKISDIVFVLDDGMIVEEGTHADLMMKKGLYATMYDSQRSWYDEA